MTPSSYGIFLKGIGAPEAGPILGVARPIRSDEWAVLTPQVQAAVRNRFQRFNTTSFYNEDLRNYFMPPLKDWGLIFRPQSWLFFITPPATAYSAYWSYFMCLFICGYYFLLLELGIAPMLAAAGSLALFFSGFSQFWWTTNGPVMAGLPWVIWTVLRPFRPLRKALLLTWMFTAWAMAMPYAPLLIDTAWAIPVIVLAFRPTLLKSRRELAVAGVAGLAAAAILYGYYSDVLEVMRNTVYPGRRVSPPGGVSVPVWASQLFPFLTFNLGTYDSFEANICEAGAVGTFFPILTICLLKYSKLRDGQYREVRRALWILGAAFALVTLWEIGPAPLWLGRIFLWEHTNPQRLLFLSGLLITIASLTLLNGELVAISWQRIGAFILIGPVAGVAIKQALYGTVPTGYIADTWVAAVAAAICLELLALQSRLRMPLLLALMVGMNVYGFGRFNPLQSAVPIFDIPQTRAMTELRARAAVSPGRNLILSNFPGATLNGLGFRSVSHALMSPQLATFRHYFPGMDPAEFNTVFNRYSNVQISRYPIPYVEYADMIDVPAEAFEPGEFYYSPANIDARTVRITLPNGMKLALLPKTTPDTKVVARFDLHFGNPQSLSGKKAAATAAAALLMSATRTHTKQQLDDRLARLNTHMSTAPSVAGATLSVETDRAGLTDALRLAAEVLRDPLYSQPEFDKFRTSTLEDAARLRIDPRYLALEAMYRHGEAYPPGDPRAFSTIDEQRDDYKKLTLADVIRFHADFFGASHAELAVVGDFDPAEVQKLAADLLGNWKSPAPYAPLKREWRKSHTVAKVIQAPGYYDSFFVAATAPNLSQSDADFFALAMLNAIIGGNPQSRLPLRMRAEKKVDCDLRSELRVQSGDGSAHFVAVSQCDPESLRQVESAFRDEMRKLLKNGVSTTEFDTARRAFIEQWQADRMQDRNLVRLLNLDGLLTRTRVQEDQRRRSISALSPQDLNAVARKYLDLASFSYFRAGRF